MPQTRLLLSPLLAWEATDTGTIAPALTLPVLWKTRPANQVCGLGHYEPSGHKVAACLPPSYVTVLSLLPTTSSHENVTTG